MATGDHTAPADQTSQITILGVGNILLADEGVGVRVVERLHGQYTFPDNVQVLDGGVLGMRLMGIIGNTDILIVVDAVKNQQPHGTERKRRHRQQPARRPDTRIAPGKPQAVYREPDPEVAAPAWPLNPRRKEEDIH